MSLLIKDFTPEKIREILGNLLGSRASKGDIESVIKTIFGTPVTFDVGFDGPFDKDTVLSSTYTENEKVLYAHLTERGHKIQELEGELKTACDANMALAETLEQEQTINKGSRAMLQDKDAVIASLRKDLEVRKTELNRLEGIILKMASNL